MKQKELKARLKGGIVPYKRRGIELELPSEDED